MSAPLLAYHGSPATKTKYLDRFLAHVAADEVVQGRGYEGGKGCFVGCTLNRYDHLAFETELGWPEWLAYLADHLFEGCPDRHTGAQFGVELLSSVEPGMELERAKVPFLLSVQRRSLARLELTPGNEQVKAAIRGVILALETGVGLEEARSAAWSAYWSAARSAESAAWSAARSAASLAAESAASLAARSAESAASLAAASLAAESAASLAARSAESAAWSAARSAASLAAESAASLAETRSQREDLLAAIRSLAN